MLSAKDMLEDMDAFFATSVRRPVRGRSLKGGYVVDDCTHRWTRSKIPEGGAVSFPEGGV